MNKPTLIVEKIHSNAVIPQYAHETDSGFDLCCLEDFTIHPGETKVIPTGLRFEIPEGYEIQVRPRSGLATKGFTVLNSPGTVDEGYRGEIKVIFNYSYNEMNGCSYNVEYFKKGSKIAQAVLCPVTRAFIREDKIDTNTDRQDRGFGSTGLVTI
jgi:dUTP pyrophosphatase